MNYSLRPYQTNLINKVRTEYSRGIKHVLVVSPCGSGKSVIIGQILKDLRDKGNQALFLVHRKELIDQMGKYTVDNDHVDLITVQSMVRRLNKFDPSHYQLIVTDESHHSMAKSYTRIYDHFDQAYRLGFTATPERQDKRGLGQVYESIAEGPSVKWLIKNHHLAPYKYYAPTLMDISKLKKQHGEYSNKSIDEQMTGRIFGDVIKNYKKLALGKKTIVYCNTIKNSDRTAEEFKSHGFKAESIHSKTNPTVRDQMVQDFKDGKIDILVNVDLFGEGFDVPDCECVILLRPTTSLCLYIQQSMRCMRYKPGKQAIIIDHVGNALKHGLPDMDRKWTLDDTKRDTETPVSVKQCPKCFAAYDGYKKKCPYCGYEIPVVEEERELEVVPEVELKELTEEDLHSMKDLYAYAKQKGYKPGWAYYQGQMRGYIQSNLPKINITNRR